MVSEKRMLPLLVSAWLPGIAKEEMLTTPTRIQNVSAVSAQLSSTQFRVISANKPSFFRQRFTYFYIAGHRKEKNGQLLLEPSRGAEPH